MILHASFAIFQPKFEALSELDKTDTEMAQDHPRDSIVDLFLSFVYCGHQLAILPLLVLC